MNFHEYVLQIEVDWEQLERSWRLSPSERVERLRHARELALGLIRGRVAQDHPDLAWNELNLKVIEEVERAKKLTRRR